MYVRYKIFRSYTDSWSELFGKAADFATRIGHEKVINVSHSVQGSEGVVAVWFLTEKPADTPDREDGE